MCRRATVPKLLRKIDRSIRRVKEPCIVTVVSTEFLCYLEFWKKNTYQLMQDLCEVVEHVFYEERTPVELSKVDFVLQCYERVLGDFVEDKTKIKAQIADLFNGGRVRKLSWVDRHILCRRCICGPCTQRR